MVLSQEIREYLLVMHTLHRLGDCLEDLEVALVILLYLHYSGHVVASVTVVGGTPHRH